MWTYLNATATGRLGRVHWKYLSRLDALTRAGGLHACSRGRAMGLSFPAVRRGIHEYPLLGAPYQGRRQGPAVLPDYPARRVVVAGIDATLYWCSQPRRGLVDSGMLGLEARAQK